MDAFLFRAMCYRDIEDYTKALEILDYILLMRPDQKDLHSIRASIMERLRNQTGTDGLSGGEDFAESEI